MSFDWPLCTAPDGYCDHLVNVVGRPQFCARLHNAEGGQAIINSRRRTHNCVRFGLYSGSGEHCYQTVLALYEGVIRSVGAEVLDVYVSILHKALQIDAQCLGRTPRAEQRIYVVVLSAPAGKNLRAISAAEIGTYYPYQRFPKLLKGERICQKLNQKIGSP